MRSRLHGSCQNRSIGAHRELGGVTPRRPMAPAGSCNGAAPPHQQELPRTDLGVTVVLCGSVLMTGRWVGVQQSEREGEVR